MSAELNELERDLLESMEEMVEVESGRAEAFKQFTVTVVDVKKLRERLDVSQEEMASGLSVSLDTLRSWELRRRNPSGIAAKVLRMIQRDLSVFRTMASA